MRVNQWLDVFVQPTILTILVPYLCVEDCIILVRQVMPFLLASKYTNLFQWKQRLMKRFTCFEHMHHDAHKMTEIRYEDHDEYGRPYWSSSPPSDFEYEENLFGESDLNFDNIISVLQMIHTNASTVINDENFIILDNDETHYCLGGCNDLISYTIPKGICKYNICVFCFDIRFHDRGAFGVVAEEECWNAIRKCTPEGKVHMAKTLIDNTFDIIDFYPRIELDNMIRDICTKTDTKIKNPPTGVKLSAKQIRQITRLR